jgi:hypothetical protein
MEADKKMSFAERLTGRYWQLAGSIPQSLRCRVWWPALIVLTVTIVLHDRITRLLS